MFISVCHGEDELFSFDSEFVPRIGEVLYFTDATGAKVSRNFRVMEVRANVGIGYNGKCAMESVILGVKPIKKGASNG